MKRILFILVVSLFSYSSYAEEISLLCKSKVTSEEQTLAEGLRELHYEELLYLDTSQNKLYILTMKQNWVLEDGTKKEAHKPIIYEDLSSYNSIEFWKGGSSQKTYSFGWAMINDKRYNLDNFLKLDTKVPANTKVITSIYMINKEDFSLTKHMQIDQVELPEIKHKCKRMN
tara:strand:+ start:1086 stop:1601 length:516 start_codon:yes stop_codon:yes gene_type:complete